MLLNLNEQRLVQGTGPGKTGLFRKSDTANFSVHLSLLFGTGDIRVTKVLGSSGGGVGVGI